jgi:Na+-driven multidrug efflux pump
MPLSSYGQAMTIFAAQNFGAKKYDRIKKGLIQGSISALIFSLVMGLVFFLFGSHIAAIFLQGEAHAIHLAHTYLKVIGVFFVFLAMLFCIRQTIQGLGDSLTPTIAGVMELVMRSFAALILTSFFGYFGLCFASPLAFIGALIPLSIALRLKLKRLKRMELSERNLRN